MLITIKTIVFHQIQSIFQIIHKRI